MTESLDPATPSDLDTAEAAPASRGWGEWVIAAGLTGIGVVVLTDGLGQRVSTSASGIGAGFMPTVVGSLMLVLAVALIVQLARGKRGEPEQAEGDVDLNTTHWIPLAVTVLALVFFVFAVEPLGYPITATIVMFAIAWAMGSRRWWASLLIAVIVSCVIYFSFTRLLTIDLPAGVLEGII